MDEGRARELLAARRADIEAQLRAAGVGVEGDEEGGESANAASDTYQAEFDEGRVEELQADLAAVERAEQRLADGSYGLSIESGRPIPDERLEALPTAERTVDEEEERG